MRNFRIMLVKILTAMICGLVIILFIVPYSEVLTLKPPLYNKAFWEKTYVWRNIEMLCIFLPFIIIGLLYMSIKKRWALILATLFSALISYAGLASLLFANQDLNPSYGSTLSILLFPLVLTLAILKRQKKLQTTSKSKAATNRYCH